MSSTATVLGRVVKDPYVIKCTDNKSKYIVLIESDKNYQFDNPDYIEVVLWPGKYFQIKEDPDYMNQLVNVHGRLETITYVEHDQEITKIVVFADFLELLSKYNS